MQYWPSICKPSLKPLKRLCRMNPEVLPEHTLPDFEFDYIDIGSVFLSEGVVARERMTFADAPSRARKPVRKGDIIISTVRTYLRAIARIGDEDDGAIVSTGFAVCRAHRGVDPSFLFRVMQSEPFIEQVVASSTGVSYPAINPSTLGNITLPCPDLPTQKAIADFLDRETARIDQLIEKKQRLLELLQQKNEVESLALVVGQEHDERRLGKLDWASSLPLHWEERAVWMIFALGRGRVISHEDIAQSPGPYPIYSSQTANDGVLGHIDTFDFEGDYLTWTTDGAKAGTVFRRSGRFNCTNVCGTLRPLDSRLDLAYFRFALDRASGFFVRHDINPKLMNGVMAKIRVPFPPYEEQKAIGGRLTAQQERLTPVREKVAASIGRLREFRAALITAAVTGQIDPETWSRRGTTDRRLDQIEAEMGA
ncbi:restriction endonuclease subunit S [Paracoccus pantotrophus]|uniref:Restriction endonuclease subunit S n=1 Tax=Paracoccus pantotrophus TaxID=82367 RepID=A0A7H9BP39_PARPN|nr:restriction endonuclease subunit S [Paracoccus pantotrophus]QLH12972.1 restriction endonuclease subunit S [Paracoccus pantotrophus]